MSQTLENIFQAIFQGCKQTAKRKKKKKNRSEKCFSIENIFQQNILR
jgi:hypothetical protein